MPRLRAAIAAVFRRVTFATLVTLGGLFAFGPPGPPVYAAEFDALTIMIRPLDTSPPSAITDLTATSGAEGQMLLQWTAPDSNNYVYTSRTAASSYVVRIATFSADSVTSTTTWWNMAQDVPGEPVPSLPGQADSLLINSLTPGVTYWAAIKGIDNIGLISEVDVKTQTTGQQANIAILQLPPSTPANLAGIALSTSSIQWSWDLASGATFYQLRSSTSAFIIASNGLTVIETGLSPNLAVARTITAGNQAGLSPPSAVVTRYTLAAPPINLALISVGATQITIAWHDNGNPAGTQYRVERSPDGVTFNPIALTTNTVYANTGLSILTTYHYRIFALNGDAIAAGPSNSVNATTLSVSDTQIPEEPKGLKGNLDPTGVAFTLIWEPVTLNTDLTPITDLAGYVVYRSTSLTAPKTRITPFPVPINVFADLVNNQIYFYTVRAVDMAGNESTDSLFADSSPFANVIFLGTDLLSNVMMPSAVNDLLRSAHNKYAVPLTIQMTETPVPSATEIVRHIKLRLIRSDTKAEVNDLAFSRPETVVAVGYSLVNGLISRGAPGIQSVRSSEITNATPEKLSMYWNNGVTWVKIGGTLDTPNQVVKTKSSFLGDYQLRIAANATSLNLGAGAVFPRLFTPNGDGYNDRVYFVLENPRNVAVMGEIFDMDGRKVATLAPPSNGGIGTTLVWDGKDSNGAVVPSGAYIYKITGEGKTFTGTVGVAR